MSLENNMVIKEEPTPNSTFTQEEPENNEVSEASEQMNEPNDLNSLGSPIETSKKVYKRTTSRAKSRLNKIKKIQLKDNVSTAGSTRFAGGNILSCTVCDINCKDNEELKQHLFQHTKKVYECKCCGYPFKLKPSLQKHLYYHYTEANVTTPFETFHKENTLQIFRNTEEIKNNSISNNEDAKLYFSDVEIDTEKITVKEEWEDFKEVLVKVENESDGEIPDPLDLIPDIKIKDDLEISSSEITARVYNKKKPKGRKNKGGVPKVVSGNLPKVDMFMVAEHLAKVKSSIESRKQSQRSSDESYGDDAIREVYVKRTGHLCVVGARILPEGGSRCTFTCNESDNRVLSIQCGACDDGAGAGACNHALALLMWLHRRTEDALHVTQYGEKPSTSGDTHKFITTKDLGSKDVEAFDVDVGIKQKFFNAVVRKMKEMQYECPFTRYLFDDPLKKLSIHLLSIEYKKRCNIFNVDDFIKFCSFRMTIDECENVKNATLVKSNLIDEMKYGRIVAPRDFKCKQNKTYSLDVILGADEVKTLYLRRQKSIKLPVRAVISKMANIVIEDCGLLLKGDWPVLASTPDGITSDYIIVIKYPTYRNRKLYIENDILSNLSLDEIQMQMYFSGRTKGLFCLVSENFEKDKKVEIHEITYQKDYCDTVLMNATSYWKRRVFPELVRIYEYTVLRK